MEELFKRNHENHGASLYGNLSPLYDFVYKQHYNYEEQAEVINEYSPPSPDSVLEGACGTGRLLHILEDEFSLVVGFDRNKSMLELAQNRTNAHLTRQDFTSFSFNEQFDVIAVLGNSITHLTKDIQIQQFMYQVREHLSSNGILILDFMHPPIVNGKSQTQVFEDEHYKVERTIVGTIEEAKIARFAFAFHVTDKETGEDFTTGESILTRFFDPKTLIEAAASAGLASRAVQWKSNYDSRSVEDFLILATK